MITTEEFLIQARALIEAGWTRGALQRDGRYCAIGALIEVFHHHRDTSGLKLVASYQTARFSLYEIVGGSLAKWNDKQKSKKPVLAAFDKAIALSKEQ